MIFCIWFYKVCKFGNTSFKNSKIYRLYQQNFLATTKVSMIFSIIFHFIYGIFKLGVGTYYKSWWFMTFAIYYLLLCFMKLSLIKNNNDRKKEYQKLKQTGLILLFLNLILIGIIMLIIKKDQVIHYNGFLIYLVAMYDFYLIIRALINVIKYRKNHNPMISASKYINLTVAMISLVSLEVAMVYQFGNNDSSFKLMMTSCMGFAICFINSFMAIYMILNANKHLKS